jgi:hypothetical protein
MLKQSCFQMMAVVAIGALLGYVAGSGKFRLDAMADASSSNSPVTKQRLEELLSRPQAMVGLEDSAHPTGATAPCCSEVKTLAN